MEGAESRVRLLAELTAALADSATDPSGVLTTAARIAGELIGGLGVVRVLGHGEMPEHFAVWYPDARIAQLYRDMDAAMPGASDQLLEEAARSSRQPLVNNAVTVEHLMERAPEGFRRYLEELDLRAVVVVPTLIGEEFIGYLAVCRPGEDRPFTEYEVGLAEDLAARVTLAAVTARSVAQLRESEENYRQIVETSVEGIWKVDNTGRTTYVNDQLARMLGVNRDDMIGRNALEFVADADQMDGETYLAERLAGMTKQYELRLRRADGSDLWVTVAGATMRAKDGTVTGALGMLADITDRVASRVLQRRLEQMQRLDSLGQLAGGIAHDFNNVLSILGGIIELQRERLLPGTAAADLAAQAASMVDKGAALTRQLLAFGRGQPSQVEVVNVPRLVDGLTPMLRRTLGEHIELVTLDPSGPPEHCGVHVDRGQLEQVIINLAVNSRDAMPKGGRLTIECERLLLDRGELGLPETEDDSKGWFVRVAVSDTGTGMDLETQRHAFEPFFTTKEAGHGTGLGLASVYGMIRDAGGMVALYSEFGMGTTVKIYLPAHSLPEQSTVTATVVTEKPAPPEPRGNARILVVEDSRDLAEVVRRLLTPAGFQLTIAHDAAQAIGEIENGLTVDILITDVVMPGMSGPELVTHLRTTMPDLPVIYTSGYTAGMLGERGQLESDAVLVTKPFNRGILLAAIDRLLNPET